MRERIERETKRFISFFMHISIVWRNPLFIDVTDTSSVFTRSTKYKGTFFLPFIRFVSQIHLI